MKFLEKVCFPVFCSKMQGVLVFHIRKFAWNETLGSSATPMARFSSHFGAANDFKRSVSANQFIHLDYL